MPPRRNPGIDQSLAERSNREFQIINIPTPHDFRLAILAASGTRDTSF